MDPGPPSFSSVASSAFPKRHSEPLTQEDFPSLGQARGPSHATGGGGGPRLGFVSSLQKRLQKDELLTGLGSGLADSVKSATDMPMIPGTLMEDTFGLLGLIDVIRMTHEDVSTLALGTDLTALGLNLNGPDHIYTGFMSPFSDNPTSFAEPDFSLSPSYSLPTQMPSELSKLSSFTDETLFYLFYAFPRDASQEASAQELYARSWRFHKELKLWLTKDPTMDATIQGPGCERGLYIFFDPSSWSRIKKEWILYYDQIEERGPPSADGGPMPCASAERPLDPSLSDTPGQKDALAIGGPLYPSSSAPVHWNELLGSSDLVGQVGAGR